MCEVSNLLVGKEESYRPSTAIVMVERGFYYVETEDGNIRFFSSDSNRARKSRHPNENADLLLAFYRAVEIQNLETVHQIYSSKHQEGQFPGYAFFKARGIQNFDFSIYEYQ